MLRLLFPYLLFGAIALVVLADPGRPGNARAAEGVTAQGTTRDPVCFMDVDDGLSVEHGGSLFSFCSERCRELFLAEPAAYAAETCLVCRIDDEALRPVQTVEEPPAFTWQGTTYRFCGEPHRSAFAEDPAGYFIHSMWGIPAWLYGLSIALILVLSFGLFEVVARSGRARETAPARFDWLAIRWLARLSRSPAFRTACQALFVALFALVVLAGLFGDPLAARNVAPLLTWTLWWGGLVVVILFAGKAWCFVCPWDAIATWIDRLGERLGGVRLELPWPRGLRNIWLATGMFVGLTWLELGFGVTMDPQATALLGLGMLSLALVSALVFERRAFCRYACLVGRVSGLYALFSASEVRAADRDACRSCRGKDCYHGNEKGVGCPTGLFPATLSENTYCIDCLECVKTCPSENMVVRSRPWGADLTAEGRPRKDEAYLALLMLSLTGFHGLTMTAVWRDLIAELESTWGLPYLVAFSLGMALLMALPVLLYAGLVRLSVKLAHDEVRFHDAFVRFAYSVLPIALFYHLAHNAEHLLMEGQRVVPLLSNPFGFAEGQEWSVLGIRGTGPWNLFGTADWTLPPLSSLPTLWLVQAALVLIGHVYSLWIADRTARRLFPARGAAWRSQLPMLAGMVLFSVFSLWLLKQPMEMRTSAM